MAIAFCRKGSLTFVAGRFLAARIRSVADGAVNNDVGPYLPLRGKGTAFRPVLSPDFLFPLTRPQMVSIGWPKVFFRSARFISSNSAEAGSSMFAAIFVFAFLTTASEVSLG